MMVFYNFVQEKGETNSMRNEQNAHSIRNITIQLEFVPEDKQQQDLADVDEIGRRFVDHIRGSGYTVKPAYTGKMGGLIFDIFIQIYSVLQDNKEVLATAAATLECILVSLKLIRGYSEQYEKESSLSTPMQVEITIPTSDGPWLIKAPDAETAITVVERLPITAPEKVKKVTQQTNAKITTSVPRRRRHNQHR